MRRALPVLVVLLAIVATLWCLRPTDVDEGEGAVLEGGAPSAGAVPPLAGLPAPACAPEPKLEGRSDAQAPAPAAGWRRVFERSAPQPRVRLHGTVHARDGTALRGAVVYQLPLRAVRGTGWVRERAETDEEGRWSFLGAPPAGTRLCARCRRHRTAFVDGTEVGSDGEHHFVLEPIPPLTVTVVDGSGEPVGFANVRAVPTTGAATEVAYRGPDTPLSEGLEMTDHLGIATFYFDRADPVMIVPEVEGHVCVPPEQLAPDAAGAFTFEVLPAGGLEIRAVDEHGAPVHEALWISVLDPETGAELTSHRGSEPDGALEAEPPLPPGRYHLDVSARGYEPLLLADFALPVGPAVARHTVTLTPLAAAARLRILLPQPTGEAKRKAVRGSGWTLLLRRTDRPWDALGWSERDDHRWDAASAAMSVDLRPGTWEVLALGARHDVVASLGPIALAPGAVVEKRARPVAALSFALYDVLPPELPVRAIRIRAPGRGLLPPTGLYVSTAIRDASGLVESVDPPDSSARRQAGGGALLGPYPGPGVVVEVDDWSGRTHRFPVGE